MDGIQKEQREKSDKKYVGLKIDKMTRGVWRKSWRKSWKKCSSQIQLLLKVYMIHDDKVETGKSLIGMVTKLSSWLAMS